MSTDSVFEKAWRGWVNSPDDPDRQRQLLRECTKAATTINELVQVFITASETRGMSGIRSPALKKMLDLIQTESQAKIVYALASKRSEHGYIFKKIEPEAKKKLEGFASV